MTEAGFALEGPQIRVRRAQAADAVYRKAPYSNRPNRTTRNADDSIYRNGGKRSQVSLRKTAAGVYVATIRMDVHRS